MSVKSTQLHGLNKILEEWEGIIQNMAGYEEEDYNPLYDLWSCLSEARDHIWYALKDDDHPGGMVV